MNEDVVVMNHSQVFRIVDLRASDEDDLSDGMEQREEERTRAAGERDSENREL